MKNVVKFRSTRQPKREGKPAGDVHELPLLPEINRTTPEQLMAYLSRNESKEYESAVVIFAKREPCPCGCGADTEVCEVWTASIANERINWYADKLKLWSMGLDIGEEE